MNRLAEARTAVTELITAVRAEGRRGAFWLPRLQELQDALATEDRLAEAAETERLLYAAPRDNFSDFYLTDGGPEANRRFAAAAKRLHTALNQ